LPIFFSAPRLLHFTYPASSTATARHALKLTINRHDPWDLVPWYTYVRHPPTEMVGLHVCSCRDAHARLLIDRDARFVFSLARPAYSEMAKIGESEWYFFICAARACDRTGRHGGGFWKAAWHGDGQGLTMQAVQACP
jgi:hypothetical protein